MVDPDTDDDYTRYETTGATVTDTLTDAHVDLSEYLDGVTTSRERRRRAELLAAVATATDLDLDAELPPSPKPSGYGDDADPWEAWADTADAIPMPVAAEGKPAIAAYLRAVHGMSTGGIALRLDVGERTVETYLSDVRAGRR